jgi:hypothetical protein
MEIEDLKRQIKNLTFKHDVCFPIFRAYYHKRLMTAKGDLLRLETKHHNLNLCYKHRQEQNRSHYSEKNCDYCKLLNKVPSNKDY